MRADGKVVYELKKRWKDGTTHVVLDPLVLMERLCALVPAPRRHLVTYHGVLAAAALDRDRVVPVVDGGRTTECRHGGWSGDGTGEEQEADLALLAEVAADAGARRRSRFVPTDPDGRGAVAGRGMHGQTCCGACSSWTCWCALTVAADGGCSRRSNDPGAIQRVLAALALSGEVPELTPARAPPDEDWVTG